MAKRSQKSFSIPIPEGNTANYIFVALLVVASFLVGTLYTKVQYLEKGKSDTAVGGQGAGNAGIEQPPKLVGEVPKITEDDHIRGNKKARYALIEYSDFECPFCGRFHPTAQQVLDEYGDDIMWVYRHYPLGFHPNAMPSAVASECVAEIGGNDKFWEYADLLFEKLEEGGGEALTAENLAAYAGQIGVDANAFSTCIEEDKYTQEIKDEMALGAKAGVEGTPGNIIYDTKSGDSRLIPGALPFEQIKPVIDEMMEK